MHRPCQCSLNTRVNPPGIHESHYVYLRLGVCMALVQTIRCLAVLNPAAEGRQQVMNTWHFATIDATTPVSAATSATAWLDTFYGAVEGYLTAELNGVKPHYRWYNLIEPKDRVPFLEFDYPTTLATSSQYAIRQTSCVVSYRAEYVSGVSPRRRRGRIYLGPMALNALTTSTGMFSTAAVTAISNAADALVTSSDASSTVNWVVYSPTTDTAGTGETGMYEVIGGWVDERPDIQRRRAAAPGSRNPFEP